MNDGGPAFPIGDTDLQGMSLRDYFAGQALNGLLLSPRITAPPATAKLAYEYADAMLAERDKGR